MIKFSGPGTLFDVASPYYPLVQFAATRSGFEGVKTQGSEEYLTVYDTALVQSKFPIATLASWVASGGEITGYPVFIQMTDVEHGQNVPAGINNASYVNESEETVNRTWAEWKDNLHSHKQLADTTWVVPGNSWGNELPATQVKTLVDAGYTLLTVKEYRDLLALEPE